MYLLILLSTFILSVNVSANEISIKNISLVPSSSYEQLRDEGFRARKDLDPWQFSTHIEWNADPFKDRNWKFQLHAWRLIDPILIKYQETNNSVFLEEAIAIIMDWYKYHIVNKKQSDMQWYDMSTGLRAMKLAYIWNELSSNKDVITVKTRKNLHDLMKLHVDKLMDVSFLSEGNHAYFQLVGLKLLCIANNKMSTCKDETQYNYNNMNKLLNKQFTKEGIHRENSTYYHIFTVKILKRLNIPNLYNEDITKLINKAELVIPWLTFPDKTIARIGDSAKKDNSKLPKNTEVHMIDGTPALIGNYMKSGYINIRTTQETPLETSTQLFITGTSNLDYLAHKHADELSFELFHNGKLVIMDSGKYSYNEKDVYRDYIKSARAHNTLSIENIEIKPEDVSASGSKITTFNKNHNSIIINGQIYRPDLFNHKREFIFYPFKKLIIKDTFKNDVKFFLNIKKIIFDTVFTSNLHINPNLKMSIISKNIVRINNYADIELQSKDCELQVIHAQESPLLGWVSFSYNKIIPASVIQARCPITNEGELIWNITLQ